jgi:hypothetical protein
MALTRASWCVSVLRFLAEPGNDVEAAGINRKCFGGFQMKLKLGFGLEKRHNSPSPAWNAF